MSNQPQNKQAVVQAKRTVADLINSERCKTEIAKVLPKHLTPERMTRVPLTATLRNPKLLDCSPESLMNSLLICSQAGLEPDGRLAHLIPYWNSKKNGYECQVIFDYKGLVTLALRNGAEGVYADKVCENDLFEAGVEDGRKILNHKPNWKKERGNPYCYYAVCKRNGEVDFEVMSLDEVSSIRGRSRAKDEGPWVTDFDEMGKKTVLRRLSKRWDLQAEIRDVINADDDTPQPFGQLTVSRPMFEAPKQVAETSEPLPEPEAPQPDAPAEEPKSEPKNEATTKEHALTSIRAALKARKITEGQLLDFWAQTGATSGEFFSLEEVSMSKPQLLEHTVQNWKEFVDKLTEAKGKK
jgi:recombination protein RecT